MPSKSHDLTPEVIEEILKAIRDLKFGVVEVVVHDSRVTEIRQTRRQRFEKNV
jgi:hypothetical protein